MLYIKTKKIALLMSISLSGMAFANTSNGENWQNQSQPNNEIVKYNIYAGNQLLKSNYNIRRKRSIGGNQLTAPIPSYPMPSFTNIDNYVNSHGGSFPMTWGIENQQNWSPARSFASLGDKDIGTELVCTDPTGCHGILGIERNKITTVPFLPPNSPNDKSVGFVFKDIKTNSVSWFYVEDFNDSFDKFFVVAGDGKFKEVTPSVDSFNLAVEFNAKYGEPIGYILLKSYPNESFKVWNGNDGSPAVLQQITSGDGSESLSSGTFWQLAWESQVGRGSALSNTISVTHGLSKTETSSLGYQLGVKESAGFDGLFSTEISTSFQQNWGWSTNVDDQKTYSTQISFPVDNDHDRGVAYYNLMLGVHTNAPQLEQFLDPVNPNGFNAQIQNHFVRLQMAKSLPYGVLGAENSLDAKAPSGEYIYGTLAVNRN
ncbi:hypothetical protein [Fluviispira sanaruensis]|uniref:Uncharacterized protein n=1 Tax=Fluviispira sanaruensis TaxID=2493639 RepID=A0A4P2VKV4_FLUSA|nr:hypothetical protein [Fluviispira sanaruensis]BBH53421.1 hypothetical protein JCM31447_18640 [Fluviispira sanaruensis]